MNRYVSNLISIRRYDQTNFDGKKNSLLKIWQRQYDLYVDKMTIKSYMPSVAQNG